MIKSPLYCNIEIINKTISIEYFLFIDTNIVFVPFDTKKF